MMCIYILLVTESRKRKTCLISTFILRVTLMRVRGRISMPALLTMDALLNSWKDFNNFSHVLPFAGKDYIMVIPGSPSKPPELSWINHPSDPSLRYLRAQGLHLPTPLPRVEQRSGEAPTPPRRADLAQSLCERAGCCGGAWVIMVVEHGFTTF